MTAQKLVHDDFLKTAQQRLTIAHLLPDYSLTTACPLPVNFLPIAPQKIPDNCDRLLNICLKIIFN